MMKLRVWIVCLVALSLPGTFALSQDGMDEPDGCCWIHLWEEAAFMGEDYVVGGPGEWPDQGEWGDSINSLEVGSCATVQAWTDGDYQGEPAEFEPGRQEPDFPGGQIASMKMTCD